jgi:hypothetical protein
LRLSTLAAEYPNRLWVSLRQSGVPLPIFMIKGTDGSAFAFSTCTPKAFLFSLGSPQTRNSLRR